MKLSNEDKKNILGVWHDFIKTKRIRVRTVYDVLDKEMLSETRLKDPKVNEQIKKFGKYYDESKKKEEYIKALDHLTKLGYVKKTKEKIHQAHFAYEAHPYTPYLYPSGSLGIWVNSEATRKTFNFYKDQLDLFIKTARAFEREISSGTHGHVTGFDYGKDFEYESEVYEIKDDFFDAMKLHITSSGELGGYFAEPYVETTYKGKEITKTKKLKKLTRFTEEQFLESKQMRKEIKKLPWKKGLIGLIVNFDGKIFDFVTPIGQKILEKQETRKIDYYPNFFGKGLYSHENLLARVFEDAVSTYLCDHGHYVITTRHTPNYLKQEIDIFGERGSKKNREILVCETKLRHKDRPITRNELDDFMCKCSEIQKNESKNTNIKTSKFLFITTTEKIDTDAKAFLQKSKMNLMLAKLPINWKKQATWKICELTEIHKKTRKTNFGI